MTYEATVLTDSPVAYWRLGEPSGTVAYDAAGSLDAEYQASPTLGVTGLLTGDSDTAATFDRSSSDYVYTYGIMPAGTTDGTTFEAWAKFATNTADAGIMRWWHTTPVANTREWWYDYDDGSFRYLYWDGTSNIGCYSNSWTPTTGVTYHLVMVHDDAAETVSFYVDGSLLSTEDVSAGAAPVSIPTSGYVSVGRAGYYFDGTMDEAAVYDYALSSTRVAAHYAAGTAAGPTWTTPADTVSMSTTPELQFDSPVAAVAQHFYLQLDTANTFDTGNLRTYDSSTSQTNWTYWDGDSWEALPSTGLPSGMSGNEIRYTVTSALSATTWYRRVRAGTLV